MESKALKQAGGDDAGTSVIAPMVLVDGQVRWEVWVKRVVMNGPLDEREVELGVKPVDGGFARDQREVMERLHGAKLAVLMPVGVEGGEARLWPILSGRVTQIGQRLDGKRDEWTVTGRCDWSLMLDGPAGGASDAAALSARLRMMDGEKLVGEAISGATMRVAMQRLCERLGLGVQREMRWVGQGVHEKKRWCVMRGGRPVVIGGGVLSDAAGAVRAMQGAVAERGPTKLIAEAGAQEVESTFELTSGWSASEEGKADAEYVKSTSSDFDAVANVYRAWVLNEDGAYGEAGGPGVDLTSLFGDGRSMAGRTVRFHGCLTRDDAGRSLGVVVEVSVDGGVNWMRYPGRLTVMTDRAGVYLEDDALPPEVFSAAKIGLAKMRVTATVASAWPTQCVRWVGNPFAGRFDEQRLDVSDRFAWRRVDGGSRYAEQVTSGQRGADVIDDRVRMEAWLAARVTAADVSQVKMQATRTMLGLRVGDRLTKIEGWGVGATVDEPAIRRRDVTLMRIEHRWEQPTGSELMWEVR